MKHLTIILSLALALLSCKNNTNKPIKNKLLTEELQTAQLDKLKLDFNPAVTIDSSVYVMYPLVLNDEDKQRKGFGSSSYGNPTTYWNVVFFNTENGEYHLLDDKRKMVIYAYDPRNLHVGSTYSASEFNEYLETGYNQVDKLIYFSITTLDFNNDGTLNALDPNYLFISDKAGKNFKQVSPDSLHVLNWQTIKGTNKILLQVVKDTNNDKEFNDEDETIPMVYDLNTNGVSKDVFNDDFVLKLKKQLDEQWAKKE